MHLNMFVLILYKIQSIETDEKQRYPEYILQTTFKHFLSKLHELSVYNTRSFDTITL